MESVNMFRTADGALHSSSREAKRYLDRKYADALSRIARGICNTNRDYVAVSEFIDGNLSKFQELIDITADMELIPLEQD